MLDDDTPLWDNSGAWTGVPALFYNSWKLTWFLFFFFYKIQTFHIRLYVNVKAIPDELLQSACAVQHCVSIMTLRTLCADGHYFSSHA